jgi:hypothetical protein
MIRTLGKLAVALSVFVAASCLAPPVESPPTTVTMERQVRVKGARDQIDVLFLIDNSSSMDPMQLELRQRFGDFFQVFEDLASAGTYADLHIGVVTSDYGAGDVTAPGATATFGCQASPGGQRGILQTLPSVNATHPPANCAPPMGAPYIAYAFRPSGTPVTNLPGGSDAAALVQQFTCMASVGARGCGFEHQLESVYAALRNQSENRGFLRDDAFLAVVFVTNEDDGSAPPTAKFYEPGGEATFGQYATFRQTRFAVECGGQPIPYGVASGGPITGCAAEPNPMLDPGAAYDISRYIDFFTQPAALGGVKSNPEDVILVALDGPEAPFETVLIDSTQGISPYVPCRAPMLSSTCIEALQHSCANRVQPGFFADPAVRLNAVVRAAASHQITSICGDDIDQAPSFSNALQQVAKLISSRIDAGCIGAPIAARSDGTPDCVVEDVTHHDGAPDTRAEIAACAPDVGPPCWRLAIEASCPAVHNPMSMMDEQLGLSIDRGPDGRPPPGSEVQAACATIASRRQ